MAERNEFWTEQRLKTTITWLTIGIIAVIIAMVGWYWYLNKPEAATPPVLQRSIDDALAKIKKNPNDMDAHLQLAQLYLQNKQYDESKTELKIIIKKDKENEVAYVLLGIVEDSTGNKKAAVADYRKAIEFGSKKPQRQLNPAITEARFRVGKIYLDQKNYDYAMNEFMVLADNNATDADARYFLGLTYYRMGKYDQAIQSLEQATRFVPDYYEAFYTTGQAYEKKGDKAKAIAAYKAALKGKSDYAPAKEALSRLEK